MKTIEENQIYGWEGLLEDQFLSACGYVEDIIKEELETELDEEDYELLIKAVGMVWYEDAVQKIKEEAINQLKMKGVVK